MHISRAWPSDTDPRELNLRPITGSHEDLAALAHVRNETLRPITLPEDYADFSAERIARFYNSENFTLANNAWLFTLSGEPVAAAVVYPRSIFPDRPPGNFDMYVVPSVRRHGLGSRLLAHLEQAALGRGHRVLETTIAGEDAQSAAFLSSHMFSVVGQSYRLTRYDLDDLPAVKLPSDYAIVSLADLAESPDLYRETTNRLGSYDANYSLLTPEETDFLASEPEWNPNGVLFLLDPAQRIVGVIRATHNSRKGELHEIRIEPSLRGQGFGRALLTAALHHLKGEQAQPVELSTSGEQTAAHNLALSYNFAVTRRWLHFLKKL